jgi:hypothetical protein
MRIASLRHAIALSILSLLLAAPWASAAQHRSPSRPARTGSLVETTWGFLALIWGTLTNTWHESGATLDPDGLSASGACGAGLAGDSGATLDPSGFAGCNSGSSLTSAWASEGATLDPSGFHGSYPGAGFVEDNGATLDPNGRSRP